MHIHLHCFTSNLIQLGAIFLLLYYVSSSEGKRKIKPPTNNPLMKYCERKVFLEVKVLLTFRPPASSGISQILSFIPKHLKPAVLVSLKCTLQCESSVGFESLLGEKSSPQNVHDHIHILKHRTVLPCNFDSSQVPHAEGCLLNLCAFRYIHTFLW